jgi:hypothetical protein
MGMSAAGVNVRLGGAPLSRRTTRLLREFIALVKNCLIFITVVTVVSVKRGEILCGF